MRGGKAWWLGMESPVSLQRSAKGFQNNLKMSEVKYNSQWTKMRKGLVNTSVRVHLLWAADVAHRTNLYTV